MEWNKEAASKELQACIREIDDLSGQHRYSADHVRWIAGTLELLEEVFGRNSRYYLTFASFEWAKRGSFFFGGPQDPEGSLNPQAALERLHHKAYLQQLESSKGLLQAALDRLRRASDINEVYEGKDTGPETSAILQVINLAERNLRKVMRTVPQNEGEVQDGFENLLIGANLPYSREKDRIEYSSKTYTPDFTMPKLDLAIDIKLCARSGREREIIQEINDYILAFQTKYGNLFFIVYDVGQIQDVDMFVKSFQEHPNVIVRVIKH